MIVACGAVALAASVYLLAALEILKLRRVRLRQMLALRSPGKPPPAEAEVDAGVVRELETGSFAAVNRDTGEIEPVDPETGDFEAVGPPRD